MDLAGSIRSRLLPLGGALGRLGVSPDAATLTGLVLALAAALAIGRGAPALGALLFGGSLLADGLDGAIARSSGRARPAGAILDAVVDRIGELALLAGVAYAADAPLLGALASGAAALPSYLRARSHEAGIDALTGPLDRGGRGALLVVGLLGASLGIDRALEVTLALIAAGSLLTALRRARAIARALAG
jgi:CDP-diacylglycerol--glycerol-3-phosphate 3-phosphatidyltransferase